MKFFILRFCRKYESIHAYWQECGVCVFWKILIYVVLFPFRLLFGLPSRVWLSLSRVKPNSKMYKKSIPENIVVSPGGVGTTFLMEYLGKYIELNNSYDKDGLKHLATFPRNFTSNKKILYIRGKPLDIVKSLESRGWLRLQSAKLGCVLCQFVHPSLLRRMFIEICNRQEHFFSDLSKESDSSVMILNYDDIWDKKSDIASFFNITNEVFVDKFPPRVVRRSVGK
jgi:hypothetical protein